MEEPQPGVAIERICDVTGLDAMAIKKLGKLGYFPASKGGLYDESETVRGICTRLYERVNVRGRPAKEHATLPTFDSMDQCTAIAHVPRSVMQMAKKGGCQAFTQNSRVILEKLLEWIFSTERDANAIDWSQEFMKERALREKNKRLKEDELLADRSVIKRGANKIMTSIFDTLDRVFKYELPASCVGKSEQEIAGENGKAINELRTKLDSDFERLGVE